MPAETKTAADAKAAETKAAEYVVASGALTVATGKPPKSRTLSPGDPIPADALGADEIDPLVAAGKIALASEYGKRELPNGFAPTVQAAVEAANARADAAEAKAADLQKQLDALKPKT